ncbi:MAG TPA: helix-turn-helix domain-containing protein [Marmoricola sp.]|nr:helix-turn-helix domain-containing protein [Marmoricola sp.]
MTSTRHSTPDYLDAARDSILAVGWRRTTLTDVARRAGVSRMTIYRRWRDMQSLLADLLVREWGAHLDDVLDGGVAEGAATVVRRLRDDELFRRIVEVDPDLLLPYLLERRGRNQDRLLELLTAALTEGQRRGVVRVGDPGPMARTLLLALQGFVVSHRTMSDVPAEKLDREMTELVERYLRP